MVESLLVTSDRRAHRGAWTMSGVTWGGATFVVAAVLVGSACADDGGDPITAPAATEEPAIETTTTSPPTATTAVVDTTTTSEAPPTTTPGTTTTVTGPTEPRDVPYWTDECTEATGDASASYVSSPGLDAFTTLGAAPSLDLVMPEVVMSTGPYGSIAGTAPIPGGVLVGVYPPDGWPVGDEPLTSSSLVAVDHDGSIRWRRCFDEVETRRFAVAPAELEPTVAWVISTAWREPLSIVGVDLATGAAVPFPTDVTALAERGDGSGRFVVLGPRNGSGPIRADDRLMVIDTLDGATSEVPVPPSWVGVDGAWVQVVDADPSDDDYVLADGFPIGGETAAVLVDGAWTDDPTVQRDALPKQVTETFGEPYELRLFDGAGDLIWAAPDFHGISREGFHWAVADDVVLAMRCVNWDPDGYCGWVDDDPPQEELAAFDIETGRELWRREGAHAVPVLVDNRAIATDRDEQSVAPTGYVLLDLQTGERIGPEGDPWPSTAFAQECCGGDVYVNVQRHGAVVVATNMEHVRIWYPPELTTPTVTVDLMD
jgi:hypothetical protein